VDSKQLVTLSFADLLAISPPMRAKVAAFIHQLDSKSVSKPVCDPPSVPVTPSHIPYSFNSARKFFAALLSSLVLVLITWALSTYVTSSSNHLGYYGYPTDMISFLLSHAMHLLMDCVLL
jgi:glycerol uptake facilitator-like aquaporin